MIVPADQTLTDLLTLARAAARVASGEILKVYQSDDFGMERKDDYSPLTLADRNADRVITNILGESGIPILSEEGQKIPYEARKAWKRFWLVDPLDGTKEFLKRNGEFTVNIALIENGKPILGVVVIPVTGKEYCAIHGDGAYEFVEGQSVLIPPRNPVTLDHEGIRVVASRSHLSPETSEFISRLRNPKLISAGSSLKFLLVATGQADIYPRFAPTMEWDTAAAHAIINEVGMSVRSVKKNEELLYNKEDLRNPGFVCG